VTGLWVWLKENPTITRTTRISATVWVGASATYTLTALGTTFVTGPAVYATAEDMMDALLAVVIADTNLATSSISGTGDAAILIVRNTETGGDVSVDFSGDGTDEFLVTADALSADLTYYALPSAILIPQYWAMAVDGTFALTALIPSLTGPLLNTAQTSRLYCQATCVGDPADGADVVPTVQLWFSPSMGTS
jgi:hypothetical protein